MNAFARLLRSSAIPKSAASSAAAFLLCLFAASSVAGAAPIRRGAEAPQRDPASDPRPWDHLRAARAEHASAPGRSRLAVALGLAPGVQTGDAGDDVSALRISLLGARHHNVSGLDLSLFCNITEGDQSGAQFGAVNVVDGDFRAVQLAWLANASGMRKGASGGGLQLAALGNFARSFSGPQVSLLWNRNTSGGPLQLALVANLADEFSGVQLAALNLDGKRIHGAQIGLANAGAESFSGTQFGLFNGVAGSLDGTQIGIFNSATSFAGLQVGAINVAKKATGWQVGLYNGARTLDGVQIGLLNHVSDASAPWLPLFRMTF